MYVVNEPIYLDLGNGHNVHLTPGPRGKKEIRRGPNGPVVDVSDQDKSLEANVPTDILAKLIEEGKISVV